MDQDAGFLDDVKHMFAETDRRMQETDRRMQETDRKLKEVGRQLGRFGNEVGWFVQELVRPGLIRMLRSRGIDVTRTFENVESEKGGVAAEFDLVAANGTDVVVVEVKKKLRTEDVRDHQARMERFAEIFPEYRERRIMGALAGMSVPSNAAAYAEKKGFFAVAPSGEDVTLMNSDGFEPKLW